MVATLIEMSAMFELDAGSSVYYCIVYYYCIALNWPQQLNLQFKRSDIEIEYDNHKIDSLMRRTIESASLLYLFYKTIIGVYLNRHESLALHKR